MKKIFGIALAAAVAFASCKKDDNADKSGILKGPEVSVHDGSSWTWAELNHNGDPVKLGVSLTNEAINSVPVGGDHSGHDHSDENNYVLKFHPVVTALTTFNHVGLGWNPVGHEPEFIYGLPHFDFHFYMMTPQQVDAIPTYEEDSLKFKNYPAPEYLPATYVNFGGGVPKMGCHWLDVTSPELNGAPFTQTFIYGSYDGKVTFYEPMITLQFIKDNPNFERSIPQPAKVQKTGWYPTKMRIVKTATTYDIVLDGLVYRIKS